MSKFKVLNESRLGDTLILTIDKKRSTSELGTTRIVCDGKKYSFRLTHNEQMICVNSTDNFVGKQIEFVY